MLFCTGGEIATFHIDVVIGLLLSSLATGNSVPFLETWDGDWQYPTFDKKYSLHKTTPHCAAVIHAVVGTCPCVVFASEESVLFVAISRDCIVARVLVWHFVVAAIPCASLSPLNVHPQTPRYDPESHGSDF